MKTNPILAAAALALAACSPEFDPASQVSSLRVLAVKAEPPEIAPAPADGSAPVVPDTASLGALVLRGDFAADRSRRTTVLYLACVPVPGDPTPSACVALASLRDPTVFLADAAVESCAGGGAGSELPPLAFAGVEACDAVGACAPVTVPGGAALPAPALALTPEYGAAFRAAFASLPADAPERILGVQAVVLAFALDATPEELVPADAGACALAGFAGRLSSLWSAREHVLTVKRVQIRGPEAPLDTDAPNVNPAISGIRAGTLELAAAPASPSAIGSGDQQLTPVLPAEADAIHQAYTERNAAGAVIESAVEEWVYSWFATVGELEDLHTRDPASERWTVAAGGDALVAAVVRDLRGGVAWTVREVTIAP